jgi:iron complex transport system permease protein
VNSSPATPTLRRLIAWALGLGLLTAAIVAACSLTGPIPFKDLTFPVWRIRVLSLASAAVVGAALAVAGAALQGLLRNVLAEPYVLGVSSGAAVGVLLGMAASSWWLLPRWASTPILAFVGALATCVLVYAVAQRRGRLDPYTLILAGVVVNAFNGAILLGIHLYLDPNRIAMFTRWAMGQIPDAANETLLIVCAALVAAGWLGVLARSAALNALGLGDAVALSAGVSVHRLRVEIFAIAGLMTAAAVALAGPIGFVGLIVPHICRSLLGPDHRRLTVVSGFAGAIFLTLAHQVCIVLGPLMNLGRVPVGILTALCGGPFFIYLLRKRGLGARL